MTSFNIGRNTAAVRPGILTIGSFQKGEEFPINEKQLATQLKREASWAEEGVCQDVYSHFPFPLNNSMKGSSLKSLVVGLWQTLRESLLWWQAMPQIWIKSWMAASE